MDSPVVSLSVGGQHFASTRETLLREPASRLALLVRGVLPSSKHDGKLFIDRDPRHFSTLLQYLRDGWALLPASAAERKELANEARHFQVSRAAAPLGQSVAQLRPCSLVSGLGRHWAAAERLFPGGFTTCREPAEGGGAVQSLFKLSCPVRAFQPCSDAPRACQQRHDAACGRQQAASMQQAPSSSPAPDTPCAAERHGELAADAGAAGRQV